MKKTLLSLGTILFLAGEFSCTGVKNVSGTLTKSESGRASEYSGTTHRDYTKEGTTSAVSNTPAAPGGSHTSGQPIGGGTQQEVIQPGTGKAQGDDGAYKKDYSKMTAEINNTRPGVTAGGESAGANDRLVKQFADMDRLADLVLYELNIVEKRWDLLLVRFKSASAAEREKIATELDLLNADQLKLYKAHVKIYKDGKTDWERTKKEVESILLSVRGISEK